MSRTGSLFLVAATALATLLASCAESGSPIDATGGSVEKKTPPPPPANANPVIVYKGSSTVSGSTRPSIMAIDADGSDASPVYRASTSGSIFRKPTWAPGGSGTSSSPWSVSFTETEGPGINKLKRVNVWVASGRVTSSPPVTLMQAASGYILMFQAWSPSTTTPEIAYVETQSSDVIIPGNRTSTLYVIPATGGPRTLIYQLIGSIIKDVTWSPDASKLAVSVDGTIHIVDRDRPTTLTPPRIILNGGEHASILYLDWSRMGGSNRIVYGAKVASNAPDNLYTTDVDVATPTASPLLGNGAQVASSSGTWSSDNGKIAYSAGSRVILSSGAIETVSSTVGALPDWRR